MTRRFSRNKTKKNKNSLDNNNNNNRKRKWRKKMIKEEGQYIEDISAKERHPNCLNNLRDKVISWP